MVKTASEKKPAKAKAKKTARVRKPDNLSLTEWQIQLRREFGREQDFSLKNLGAEPVFSEFAVTNPKSRRTYRVAIRGTAPGTNYCSCPDFSVNTLGTCKHIEWLLGRLEKKRGAKKAFREGFHPEYSEVYLQYGVQRTVRFRPGAQCPAGLLKSARAYFDDAGDLLPGVFRTFECFVREAANSEHEVRVYDDALSFVAQLRDDETRRREVERQFEGPRAAAALSKLLKTTLYPYQQAGAVFAAKAGRCLLADDMGLGKTIQAIAAVEILARTVGVERIAFFRFSPHDRRRAAWNACSSAVDATYSST